MKKFLSAFAAVTLLCANAVLMSCSSDDDSISTTGTPLTKYTCTNCNTEYDTEAEKNSCAIQSGCPKYVASFNFYETAVNIDGTSATASSTYVYFGVFPKTVLPKTSDVTVDETNSITMGANTYYKGTDGNYYAKVLEDAEIGPEQKYTDGTQASKRRANSYRYFKVEPIKWKVLTTDYNSTGKALLLADDILTTVPYYDFLVISDRTINNVPVYANNYEYSQIRAYLNGLDYYYYDEDSSLTVKKTDYTDKGFLQTAFTSTAQALIAETEVDNSADSTIDADNNIDMEDMETEYACANTTDKIFLLSEKEVTTTAYGFAAYDISDNARIRVTTDYAKANYARQNVYWWLRSPSYEEDEDEDAQSVNCDGKAYYSNIVDDYGRGVVPALSISF